MLNPFHDVHCYFWSLFSLDKISICGFHLLFLNSKELDSVWNQDFVIELDACVTLRQM